MCGDSRSLRLHCTGCFQSEWVMRKGDIGTWKKTDVPAGLRRQRFHVFCGEFSLRFCTIRPEAAAEHHIRHFGEQPRYVIVSSAAVSDMHGWVEGWFYKATETLAPSNPRLGIEVRTRGAVASALPSPVSAAVSASRAEEEIDAQGW
eukprot:2185887-Rhodomonas_salina.2